MTGPQQPSDTPINFNQRLDIDFALQAAGLGVWQFDPVTKQVLWDDRCRQLFGLAKDNQLPYEQAIRFIHPDDQARVDQAVQQALSVESDGQYDVTYRTVGANDGLLRWVRFMGRAEFTPAGQVHRFAGMALDVTALVKSQQAIEQSQQLLLSQFDESPVGIATISREALTFRSANPFYGQLVGRSPQQLIGKPLLVALPELAGQGFEALLEQVMATNTPYTAPEVAVDLVKEGQFETIYVNLTYQPQLAVDGQVDGVLVVATDVTPHVLARRTLEQSEARFRSLIEEAPVATCLFVGRELRVEFINEPMITIFGKGLTVLGKPLALAVPELAGQPFLGLLDEVFTSGQLYQDVGALAYVEVDGVMGSYYFDFTYKPLRNAAGEVYAILEMATNVTKQVMASQQLEASEARYRQLAEHLEEQVQERTEQLAASNEELSAINEELTTTNEDFLASNQALEAANHDLLRSNQNLEQFAYIASHDMQEPLRKIQQFGDLLKNQYGDHLGDGVIYLERMQTAATRMSGLIKDLLAFSRIATTQVIAQPVALNQVVSRVLDTLSVVVEESGAQVEVTNLPVVPGDRSQLDQLFQNLLSNALKFRRTSPAGELVTPQIRVKASLVDRSQLPPSVQPCRYAQTYHCIEVADNGIGFEAKYLDRIFQVFQRLHGKNEFSGTGIGLAIVQKVVTNHGGAITATSKPGQGATFCVYLPT